MSLGTVGQGGGGGSWGGGADSGTESLGTGSIQASEAGASATRSLKEVADLASRLCKRMLSSTDSITLVTGQTRMLSINARIEAARAAGETGAAFSVVATEMSALSDRVAGVASKMRTESEDLIRQLLEVNRHLATDFRGGQLAEAALTAMDLIDRNLYERSCDCRWWATDASAVDALTALSAPELLGDAPGLLAHANRRLGVILDAYTVYLDIVLADANGRVVARGRPEKFPLQGQDVSGAKWFKDAMATPSGQQFAFESAHESPLVGGEQVLVYSAAVRERADNAGRPLGVLGVLFDWKPFARRILASVPLTDDERKTTRVCVIEPENRILADTHPPTGPALGQYLHLPGLSEVLPHSKNFATTHLGGRANLLAHGRSPGFETYSTGWHCVIVQPIEENEASTAQAA